MQYVKSRLVFYLFFAFSVILLFRDAIFIPHKILYTITGDGIKNVFTSIYHIKYGSGTHFTGMNYPFGEHVLYTDNQPLLSIMLAWLDQYFDFSIQTLLGIIHTLMPVSFFIAMVYVFKILLRFRLNALFAMLLSSIIIWLSPQVFRVPGHFALSYACFIPMLFYWNIKFFETQRYQELVKIFFLCCIFSLLHLYYLVFALMWMCAYVFGYFISVKKSLKKRLVHLASFVSSIVCAFLVVSIFIKVTDTVVDRPAAPLGSESLNPISRSFTTFISPLWQGIQEVGLVDGSTIKQDTNDPAYIAIPVCILLITGIFIWLKRRKQKKPIPFQFEYIWLITGVLTLLYALYISSLWNLPVLETVLKPLKQFRSTDRISWIFYYIGSIYAAVILQYIFRALSAEKSKLVAYVATTIITGLWIVEANGNAIFFSKVAPSWQTNYGHFFHSDIQTWPQFLKEKNLRGKDFQAIVSLPFVDVGSEKIWLPKFGDVSIAYAFRAALPLNIPIMDINMSRTSWSQSFDQSTINSGWFGQKRTLQKIKDDRPLLVIHHAPDKLNPDEQTLLTFSTFLGKVEMLDVYMLYPKHYLRIQDSLISAARFIAATQINRDTAIGSQDFYFVHHGFTNSSSLPFAGEDSFRPVKQDDSKFLTITLPKMDTIVSYEFSVWVKAPADNYKTPDFTIVGVDGNGNEIFRKLAMGKYSNDNEPGLWLRVYSFFEVPKACTALQIIAHNDPEPTHLAWDELLIRPVNTVVISKFEGGTVMANNHLIHRTNQ